ncbi:MAG: xanthine dehydrogenase family protein molybdopterin-binding subunit [Pigmentiphaga sp.]|uniref:xanthine dehydrogenase family protein molybdopterin-binding subunit n=1 Tax=Pigmentiphaga sp. TaxID=1977564 RepID=UPI0029AD598C|nr:xanthine dehydrogenase family protein molybdopterin-binding subunit [Pigmentiphaga sp.]MDX3908031.1 xanthine dehydrogenase family protein molybdopterin-binding subunit [Pigmentiphaga sp.]
MKGKTFGRPMGRVEDAALLTGRARFVDDIDAPGMLHAAFVRSSHAHARILAIDTSMAAAAPGVRAVLTLDELRPLLKETELVTALPAPNIKLNLHRPILATGEVLHVGEPIAMVLADDRYLAEDAAAMVFVDYDALPVVADCETALEPGSPVAHSWADHNLVTELSLGYGDVDAVFANAPHVYRERLSQHRGGSHSMEGRGVVAQYDPLSDLLTMWSSTQTPMAARQFLCDLLGRSPDQVRVITPDVGGGFGPKLVFYPEEAAVSAAALMLKRPVKWIEDRREHFTSTTQERDQIWEVEIAVDNDARILGVRGSVLHDHGAYSARGTNVPYGSIAAMPLAYVIPAYRMDARCVTTNKVPVTPVRGAGQPQGVFAMERLMDRVARELNLDRAEVRRRNLVPAERMPYATPLVTRGGMQVVLDSGDYPRCQAMALEAVGWNGFAERRAAARKQGKRLGLGLANSVEGTGRGPYEQVRVQIGTDGKVHVYTGAAAMGQGLHTMLAQVVAEQLGGDLDNVAIIAGDTAQVSLGFGGFNSRQAVMAGSSAHKAALRVRGQLLAVAAAALKVPQDDLRIEGREVVASSGARADFAKLARASGGVAGFYLPAGTPGIEATENVLIDLMAYANACAAVEVEVDEETGAVTLRNIVFVHDCGTVINPQMVEGQVLGGIAHGIGNALYERMGFDDNAQPVTTNLAEYLLVTATEMPPVTLLHVESPSPLNELGLKGCGEAGVLPIPAAIASAIDDALSDYGVHIDRVPVSPVELLAKIEAARNAQQTPVLAEEGAPA